MLRPDSTQLLITGKVGSAPGARYAYGFEDCRDMEGNGPVGHGGGAPGMNGDLRIYPKSGYIMVALANMAVWTLLEFEAEPGHVGALSSHLSSGLASPGWYASFGSGTEVWVIFPGRVFRYDRADASAHDEVSRYAHAAGVPDDQCDW